MTQLGGLFSVLFIVAAFVTSCNPQPTCSDDIILPSFTLEE